LCGSYQKLSFKRGFGEPERLRVEPATDPQRHIERRDETEAAAALVIPTVDIRIEWKSFARFREPAREFLARDDAISAHAVRARLLADAAHRGAACSSACANAGLVGLSAPLFIRASNMKQQKNPAASRRPGFAFQVRFLFLTKP
jgi:hypothetical protein